VQRLCQLAYFFIPGCHFRGVAGYPGVRVTRDVHYFSGDSAGLAFGVDTPYLGGEHLRAHLNIFVFVVPLKLKHAKPVQDVFGEVALVVARGEDLGSNFDIVRFSGRIADQSVMFHRR